MEIDSRPTRNDLENLDGVQDATPDLERKLNEAEERIEHLRRALLDAQKELSHVHRRAKEDLEDAYRYSIETFARSLLSFKDNLETSLRINTEDVQAFRQGLNLSARQLDSTLESYDLHEINPAIGDSFDAARHSLANGTPAAQNAMIVTELHRKGYAIGGRLLRPALVSVAASPARKG